MDIESTVERIQNKIKRSPRLVWVYCVEDKFVATTSPDARLDKNLLGVYSSRADTYLDEYVDEDIRWMAEREAL